MTNINFIPPAATLPATQITDSSAMLNGNTTPYGDGTLYWFQYGLDTNYGQFTGTNSLVTSSNLVGLSAAVSGLAAATLVHCQLVVTDDWGTQYGEDVTFTTGSSNPPVAITLAASSVSSNRVVLNGLINPEGSPTYGWFFLYDPTYTYASDPVFMGSGSNAVNLSQAVPNLIPGTTYSFATVASNANGTIYGSYTNFTTLAVGVEPAAPAVQTLTAMDITSTNTTLTGNVNPNGLDTTAWFEYGYNSTSNYVANLTPPTSVGNGTAWLTFTNLTAISYGTYIYRIGASNSLGTAYGSFTNFTVPY
jgi:hypothetical protein